MRLTADNVQSMVVPDCGHWVAEEAPDQLRRRLPRSSPRTETPALTGRLPGRWPRTRRKPARMTPKDTSPPPLDYSRDTPESDAIVVE